jgi:hypothetical protein
VQIEYLEPAGGGYRPGACNIGPREIAKRRAYGVAGIVSAIVLGIVLLAIDAPPLARGLIVLPLWGAIISLEQARRKFCAGFAYAGIRSVAGSNATERVDDRADLAADRATARRMVAYCGAIAAAITAVFVLLPI